MTDHRPVNLNLLVFRWPIAAIASIFHRVTGVVAFIGIAFMFYALQGALASPAGFDQTRALMASAPGRFITFGLLAVLGYHFVAGIKHLLLDLHVGDSLEGGRFAAQVTLALGIVLAVLAGVWVYGY